MKTPDYTEFLAPLSRISSMEDIHEVLSDLCLSFGFDHFLYCARIPTSLTQPSIVIVSGYPQEWWSHYNHQKYRQIDPIVAHCVRRVTPLPWETLKEQEKENPKIHQLMQEARDFGLKQGVSVPVHHGRGELGILGLAASERHPDIGRLLPTLHLLTTFAHEAIRKVIEVREIVPSPPELTSRERECLLWAAEGKTSWEISQILSISERTVIFHLQNAGDKLKVSNRQQAVARALSMGLLTPVV